MALNQQWVAGVDEVGRGPLAGDVVTAAVILDPKRPVQGLADSKKLTEKRREMLFNEIKAKAAYWCIARASVAEIDQFNILQASLIAMQRAVDGLAVRPNYVYVDGNKIPRWNYPSEAVVGGDALIQEISAASILAKVTRDREMIELDTEFPGYGLAKHKGYPTKTHLDALRQLGPTPIHRTSFGPVRALLVQQSLF